MSQARGRQTVFENDGAGPLFRGDKIPPVYYVKGEIKFWPFPPDELPFGFYLGNGDLYPENSPQGEELLALSPAYRAAWGITLANGQVNMPKFFDDEGDGYFPRAVDGVNRAVGSKQDDAIRNIKSVNDDRVIINNFETNIINNNYPPHFVKNTNANKILQTATAAGWSIASYAFDASLCVPVASENRPKNMGLLPCVYLGV